MDSDRATAGGESVMIYEMPHRPGRVRRAYDWYMQQTGFRHGLAWLAFGAFLGVAAVRLGPWVPVLL